MQGMTLGPYRIDAELGAGGMGRVYRATTLRRAAGLDEGVTVALKVVHAHLLETEGFFKRFLREAQIGRSVVHENVVRTFECDSLAVDGRRIDFLVMEYVEGQTLRELLEELDRVPEELCRHIGREVAKGLAAIHAAGVVHRDVKPENVIISRSAASADGDVAERPGTPQSTSASAREGHVRVTNEHAVKVMDLGVARLSDEALRLSQTGAFVGSIHYAAPECFSDGGRNVDGRADLHALGLVLYELSCGVNPYLADDVPQILKRILHEEPRRLGDVNPQLSPFFEEVVHCLLAKKPGDRFADANSLLAVLEQGERSAWWRARANAITVATHRPLRRIRIPRETAVYGRDAEIAKLRALFGKAKSGEGQVVVIEGEAGIGKSRVVDELIGRLQRDGEDMNFLFGSYPPGGAATAAGAFSTAYREQFGEAGSAGVLPQTPSLVPAFDALLRGEPTPGGCEPLTKDSLHTCFVHATRNLAAERTTIVLIDDLHFAPDEGRALFAALATAVPGHRVLIVGTTRPGADERWFAQLSRLPQTTRLQLARLGPKDLVRLLAETLRSDHVAAELSAQIALKSDGNPFFVFEILRGLREGQFITQRADGTWITTRVIGEIRIPSSVLDLVNARVADLSQDERDLLDVACCSGFEFDPLLVGDVLGVARIPLLKRLAQIERQHRLVRSAGLRFVFDHHQVQEALYGSMSELLRREYHAALAAALEARTGAAAADPSTLDGALCVDLCEHFLAGDDAGRAPRYLAAAHSHLEKGHLSARAAALAERALAVPGLLGGPERARTLIRLCNVLDVIGRRARQEEAAREAARLADAAGDDALRLEAARVLGACCWRTSRFAEAVTLMSRTLELAIRLGDRRAEAVATGNLGTLYCSQGRLAESLAHQDRSLALGRELGDHAIEARALGNLGNVLWTQGRLDEAKAHHERHLALSREFGDRQGESRATQNLGNVFGALDRLAEARECFERSLAVSREIGDREGEARATGCVGTVLTFQGHLADARRHHERHLELCTDLAYREGVAIALHNIGAVLREEQDAALAEERLRECLAIAEEIGHRHLVALTHLVLGSIRAASGAGDRGRASLETARDLAVANGFPAFETLARCELALLPGGDARDALAAFAANEGRLSTDELREARWLLWKATRDRAHLAAARRVLDEALAKVPPADRAAMVANVRLNREIAAAAREQGL